LHFFFGCFIYAVLGFGSLFFFLWVFFYCFDRLIRRFGILYIVFFFYGFCLPGSPCGASSPAFPALLGELMWFYFAGKANH
jgi:hypothetical protein